MKVNERQVIYQFNNASKILPNGDCLDHLGLEVDDLKALRTHLLAHGVTVKDVTRGRIGDFILTVKDPDGRTYEMTQFAPEGQLLKHQGQNLPVSRISAHLLSATIRVADLAVSLRFYRDILGFTEVGKAGADGSVRIQVPDGTDYLILSPYDAHSGQPAPWAVPEYALAVPDVSKAAAILKERARTNGSQPPSEPTLSAFGKREVSIIDPDGVRVVLLQN
jgi:catechol 2,3-dioxygenase-like lactoylglutathione lyase family enzyme